MPPLPPELVAHVSVVAAHRTLSIPAGVYASIMPVETIEELLRITYRTAPAEAWAGRWEHAFYCGSGLTPSGRISSILRTRYCANTIYRSANIPANEWSPLRYYVRDTPRGRMRMSEVPDGFVAWRRFTLPFSGGGPPMRFWRVQSGVEIVIDSTATIVVGDPIG